MSTRRYPTFAPPVDHRAPKECEEAYFQAWFGESCDHLRVRVMSFRPPLPDDLLETVHSKKHVCARWRARM